MIHDPDRIQQLFDHAVSLSDNEQNAYLNEACGDDAALRAELESLLANADAVGTEQDSPLGSRAETIAGEYAAGDTVGPFTIRECIGTGGMGSVYLAQQSTPVRRTVALKVILAGLDTRNTLARFQVERQALSMMDHPGIARVLEAGATDTGRPWFAMEHIKGNDLNVYCDRNRLNITQRLELFIQICDAVQHAHQKGVIHRDLKPGNILVARDEQDQPQAKIIDFGIAKAMTAPLTQMTLHTSMGQAIGTISYMSPEQLDGSVDVDTRTDVYSLGVILYELLTGSAPFDVRGDGDYESLKRSIREDEPPKPSTKLASLTGEEATRLSKTHRTDLLNLGRQLRRELEWIPLKALNKDRAERYSSPEALAQDVRRYLTGEALVAGPPTTSYRLRKFLRRHRVPMITAACFGLLLIGATVVSLLLWAAAEQQRDVAEQKTMEAQEEWNRGEAVKDFLTTMLSSVDPKSAGSMDKELMKLVLSEAAEDVGTKFEDQPLVEAEIRDVIGVTFLNLGQDNEAELHLAKAMEIRGSILGEEHPSTLKSMTDMGDLLSRQSHYEEAMPYLTKGLDTSRRILGDEHPNTLKSIGAMGYLLSQQGKYEAAMPYVTEALETSRRILGEEHPSTLKSMTDMGDLLSRQGKYEEAMPHLTKALETSRRILGDEHPSTLKSIIDMGYMLLGQSQYEDAMIYFNEALETNRLILGDEHANTLKSMTAMGYLLAIQDKSEEAMLYYAEALETSRGILGDEHDITLHTMVEIGNLHKKQGKYEQAMPYYTEVLTTSRRIHGDGHLRTLDTLLHMGGTLSRQGKYEEALLCFAEALETSRRILGNEHHMTISLIRAMGDHLSRQGKVEEAKPYYTEALETERRILSDEHP